MTTMKERISNVIAWVGFNGFVVMALAFSVSVWDLNRDKPELIEEVRCEDADGKKYENLFLENYQPSDCSSGQLLSKWRYKGAVYGYVGYSSRLLFAESNIDGYSMHNIGENVAESIVPWALPLWLISIVLNYILFGSARLLPWRKAVINEEAS
jgi:hypothetical protein